MPRPAPPCRAALQEKSYAAVCWLPRPLSEADVAVMEGTRDLVIQQRTPIRVGGWVHFYG